jgi:glutathione S-transferase fosA5
MNEDAVLGVSHITLSVADLERSISFYHLRLGLRIRFRSAHSAYLESGALWLALVQEPEARKGPLAEYTHVALAVEPGKFGGLTAELIRGGAVVWRECKRRDSFYFLDPDGHKLELHTGTLEQRLAARRLL